MEGVKVTRAGRGKGEQTGSNKRLTTAVAKSAVENVLRGVKTSESSITTPPTPPTEIKVKGKSQSTITTFLEGGAQDMRPVHFTLPSESKVVGTEPPPSSSSSSISGCITNNDPSVKLKQGIPESEDSQREVREKNSGSYTEIKQPQAQHLDWSEQLEYRDGEGGASILKSTTEEENLHKSFANTKTLGKTAGKVSQLAEWGKDNSDKFYSLTEESDLSSGDHSLGGSEDSETSETEDKTSSNEPTVRQLRRQRKLVKARPCAQGSSGNPSSTGAGKIKTWTLLMISNPATPVKFRFSFLQITNLMQHNPVKNNTVLEQVREAYLVSNITGVGNWYHMLHLQMLREEEPATFAKNKTLNDNFLLLAQPQYAGS
ncbi:hypothetical protein NDU88_002679 [Pleurodeles waltl]|uniref:Uncharacterized protein n=1 Tax=Pleurodeles waltl TaxID=8319 RepID=A0AAV7UXS7_PLEWA|nr:hypothetical protein NDU88_002679 [Pleurodeles waltl]